MNSFLSVAALLFLPVIAAEVQPSNGKLGPLFDPQQAAIKIDDIGLHLDLRGRALATGNKAGAAAAPKEKGRKKESVSGKKYVSSGKKVVSSGKKVVSSGKKVVSSGKKGASSLKKGTSSVKKDTKKKSSKKATRSGKKSKGKKKKSFAGRPIDSNFGVSEDGSLPPYSVPPPEDGTLAPGEVPPPDDGALPPDELLPREDSTLPPDVVPPPEDETLPPDVVPPPEDETLPTDVVPPPEDGTLPPDVLPPPEDETLPPSPNFETQFAMIRSQAGSPDGDGDGPYPLASTIGVNGFIYALDEGRIVEQKEIGQFKGACTVVSENTGSWMCTYEIILTENQNGVIITSGKFTGVEDKAIVTGAELDFAEYTGGVLTTIQDPDLPVMYSHLLLY